MVNLAVVDLAFNDVNHNSSNGTQNHILFLTSFDHLYVFRDRRRKRKGEERKRGERRRHEGMNHKVAAEVI